jgi:hypothetical protein
MAGAVAISVLVPLQEDRATAEQCVRAWTRDQTLSRDRYEVIVLAPGLDPRLEARIRPLLRPEDRWVPHGDPDEYGLFNLGARLARARWLFLTEAHCVPEPDCLMAMLDHLEATGGPGARGASHGVGIGALGRLERDVYDEHLRIEEEPEHWRKVLIHSLAVDRVAFLGVGGFAPRYGDFAPWALAIALREAGHRLTFTPRPAVRHIYTGELRLLCDHVRDFGRGEMRFLAETPASTSRRYLSEPEEWKDRWSYTRVGARRVLGVALRAGLLDRGVAREAIRHTGVAMLGPRVFVATWRVRVVARRLRVRLSRAGSRRRRRAYERFWEACAGLGRREFLAAEPALAWASGDRSARHRLSAPFAGQPLIGFHIPEEVDGHTFRWSSPLALIEATVPDGAVEAQLELLPERGRTLPAVRVCVDGRVVAPERCTVTAERVRFPVQGGAVRCIAVVSASLRPSREGVPDRRDLGLAVRALSFRAVG